MTEGSSMSFEIIIAISAIIVVIGFLGFSKVVRAIFRESMIRPKQTCKIEQKGRELKIESFNYKSQEEDQQ